MQLIYLQNTILQLPASVTTIGFFDGVHLGHRSLIHNIVEQAKVTEQASMVVTFSRHPKQVVQTDFIPTLLTTTEEKFRLLEETGIDYCVVLDFDRKMSSMSAREFMQEVLKKRLNIAQLFIGHDNRFGHNRAEGFADYFRYGVELGIKVYEAQGFTLDGIKVSSSVIRRYLTEGNVVMAQRCLGYPYSLTGKVVKGFQEGRKLGFPTANMQPNATTKLIPGKGIYIVWVEVEGHQGKMRGMTNIGNRPTYGGIDLTIETYILDFSQDIYGSQLTIYFEDRIRDEVKFDTLDALKEKIKEDETLTRKRLHISN